VNVSLWASTTIAATSAKPIGIDKATNKPIAYALGARNSVRT
jgi:hypothetical protein